MSDDDIYDVVATRHVNKNHASRTNDFKDIFHDEKMTEEDAMKAYMANIQKD